MTATATSLETMLAQLAELQKARAKGIRRVRDTTSSGAVTEIEYRTDGELAAAIAALERRIAMYAQAPIRTVRFNTSKGF